MSVKIIAEIGVNHNGDIQLARELIDAAKKCGADMAKLQLFRAESLVTKNAQKADYQRQLTGVSQSQYDMLKSLEISNEQYDALVDYGAAIGIPVFATGFDIEDLQYLATKDQALFKIPSGEITNLPYLEFIAEQNKPVILSTGMADFSEVERAVNTLINGGLTGAQLTVLHCTTNYPAQFSEVNLNAMVSMGQQLNVNYGYSDHTMGTSVAIAAVALGARLIEKHFTLDSQLPGPDHKASLEPGPMKEMIQGIRHIELAFGDGVKAPTLAEGENAKVIRKSLVAKKNIVRGEPFTRENIAIKRPGTGLSPFHYYDVLGKTASKDFQEDELIKL